MPTYKFVKTIDYDAVGGPSERSIDSNGNSEDPTNPGRFVVYSIDKYIAGPKGTYPETSGVKWGTPLRIQNEKMQIKPNGIWQDLTTYGNFTKYRSLPANEKGLRVYFEKQYKKLKHELEKYLTKAEQVQPLPDTWIFTDFGHITIKYFADLNGDYVFNGKDQTMIDYIHTTPRDEFRHAHKAPFNLGESHGCIHVKPADIDTFINNDYVKNGSVVEVKSYINTLAPLSFESEKGRPDFEMHFYPALKKIIVDRVTKIS